MIKTHKSYLYAKGVLSGTIVAPRYVVMQCAEFLSVADGKDPLFFVDEELVAKIDGILQQLYLFKGRKAGTTIYDATAGYEWLAYIAVLCIKKRADPNKRRYRLSILEICRKNYKTFTVAVILLLLFLFEPAFSRFFSVAPTGELSREVMLALSGIIKNSPALFSSEKSKDNLFRIRRDDIICRINDSVYKPLNYSNDKLDGKEPAAFVVDEAGVLPNSYAIDAMQSGQLSVANPLGFIISTKYPKAINAFEDSVTMAKQIFDGTLEDDSVFALLYEPDDPDKWMTDDNVLLQSNPVAQEDPDLFADLKKKRALAIVSEPARENFLTKHCNIIYRGLGVSGYIPLEVVQRGRRDKLEWEGKDVYLGVDLAMTTDNCSVAMTAATDDGGIQAEVLAFIPADRIDQKSAAEKIDYYEFIRAGKCIACGGTVVDYSVIEDFVFGIEEKYGVHVMGIGYDRWNALSSAQKWEAGRNGDGNGFNTVMIKQHSDTLHMPTKLLLEMCEQGKFTYETNRLLEINFENAKCTEDTNLNKYVNKKRSRGKVDMVVALINSIYLLQQDVILGEDNWVIQT